ncbi:MAG TPA: Hint domain-containing protein, partial [Acetobacteraceae bacterium]
MSIVFNNYVFVANNWGGAVIAGNTAMVAWVEADDAVLNGTISQVGDTVTMDVGGVQSTLTAGNLDNPDAIILTDTDFGTDYVFAKTPISGGDNVVFTNSTLGDFDTACFAAGTRIRTRHGDIAVEALAAGDEVFDLHSDSYVPVAWIGHRRVDASRHRRPGDVRPVRIARHAFGPHAPARDLLLSPDHAVFTQDALIPVRYLVNGASIVQTPTDQVTYYHVELARHGVLLAEGLPTESYLDTGNRSSFANGGEPVELHPDFARRRWDEAACAPLVTSGPQL